MQTADLPERSDEPPALGWCGALGGERGRTEGLVAQTRCSGPWRWHRGGEPGRQARGSGVLAMRSTTSRAAILDDSKCFEVLGTLKGVNPEVPILIFTMQTGLPQVLRAFQEGASGYMTKDSSADEMITATRPRCPLARRCRGRPLGLTRS